MLSEILRKRWFSLCLHAGLWLLLLLALVGSGIGRRSLPFWEAVTNPAAVSSPVPVAQLERLFAPASYPKIVVDPSTLNLFSTSHFIPPSRPPPPPPPPPPTTWKIELTYQGYYRTGDGPKYALVLLGEKLVPVSVGSLLVTNLFVVDAAMQTLILTNTSLQTNVLSLNKKQTIEVPIK